MTSFQYKSYMLTNKVRILTLAARKKLTMIALALTLMMSNGQRDGDVDHYLLITSISPLEGHIWEDVVGVRVLMMTKMMLATHQYLASAGEGGDMEGHIGEDEERIWVLWQLLQPGDVVRTSEREVHQQAGKEVRIRICPTHNQCIFEFISLISILDLYVYKYRIYIWICPTWT